MAAPCLAAGVDDIFANSDEMFNNAYGFLFEYGDESADKLAQYAKDELEQAARLKMRVIASRQL